jgi:hypothetical protein
MRLEEGAWDRALTLLVDSLHGMTHDQAIAILKGEATLTGDSGDEEGIGYEVLPEGHPTQVRMAERLEYMYGGLFRHGDKLFKPYAIVHGWCREDYHFSLKMTDPWNVFNGRDLKQGGSFRSLFYANDPHHDMLVHVSPRLVGDIMVGDVLCEEFKGRPPFWYKIESQDPVNFIEALLKTNHRLDIRGAYLDELSYTKSPIVEDTLMNAVEEVAERVEASPPNGTFGEEQETEEKLAKEDKQRLLLETFNCAEQYLAGELKATDYDELRKLDITFERVIDALHSIAKSDEWDRIGAIRDGLRAAREKLMGTKVNEAAEVNGGFLELPLVVSKDGEDKPWPKQRTLRVPKYPFLLWCLRGGFDFEAHGHEDIDWKPVAGSGWKMSNDDPFHTDWMLGAGIPLKDAYERNHEDEAADMLGAVVRHSSWRHRDAIVKEYSGHQFTTLARGDTSRKYAYGEVVHPKPNERVPAGSIAIVPNAGPDYQIAMETANGENPNDDRGLIICEVGGKLAHLVIVGREFKCTVLMMPNALAMFPDGSRVWIDLEDGTIESKII